MRTCIFVVASIAVVTVITGCGKVERSYSNSECAKCGQTRHVESIAGRIVADEVRDTDLSKWLSKYSSTPYPCKHRWMPLSSWSSGDNLAVDFINHFNMVLRQIKKLEAHVGQATTAELLARYQKIQRIHDAREQAGTFEEFRREVKARLDEATKPPATSEEP